MKSVQGLIRIHKKVYADYQLRSYLMGVPYDDLEEINDDEENLDAYDEEVDEYGMELV